MQTHAGPFHAADDPKDVIVAAARRLDQREVPLKQFGVQFAQIGDDPEASEALQELDDDIAAAHGIRVHPLVLCHCPIIPDGQVVLVLGYG